MSRLALVPFICALSFLTACGGGSGPVVRAPKVVVDTFAPTTAANPEGGDFATEIDVVLTASEAAIIHVSRDGADFEPAGESPATLRMIEGSTTIQYFAIDLAGNIEVPTRTQRYLVDLSPPVITLPDGEPEPLPWLASAQIEWRSDEQCDYVVTVVETDEALDEGELDLGATGTIEFEGVDLPDEPITIRIEATDWTGRSSTLDFTLQRAAPNRIATMDAPGDVIVLPTGDRAFIARRFLSKVDVLNLDTEEIVETIDVGIRAWSMTLNADATRIYVSNALSPGAIATIDVDSYDVESLSASVGIPGAVAFSADGALGYFTDFTGAIRVLDTDPSSAAFHTVVDTVVVDEDVLLGRIVVGPQGDFLLLNWSGIDLLGLEMVEFGGGDPQLRTAWASSIPRVHAQSHAIALSAEGKQAFVSSVKLLCGLCRFDLEADELVHSEDDPHPDPEPVVKIDGKPDPDVPQDLELIDADDRLLTVGSNGRYVHLYETESMKHRSRYEIGAGARSIAVTPDGKRAVVARSSGSTTEILVVPLR